MAGSGSTATGDTFNVQKPVFCCQKCGWTFAYPEVLGTWSRWPDAAWIKQEMQVYRRCRMPWLNSSIFDST